MSHAEAADVIREFTPRAIARESMCARTAPDPHSPTSSTSGEDGQVHEELETIRAEFGRAAEAWEHPCPSRSVDEGHWGRPTDGRPKDKLSLRREADKAREEWQQEEDRTQREGEAHQDDLEDEQALLDFIKAWEVEEGILPLVTQVTRSKMLAHRVRERVPLQVPEPAEALLAITSVYQDGVAAHKLLPDDRDFAWTRDRWQCLERLLPAAADAGQHIETIEDSLPDNAAQYRDCDFTAMQYQREYEKEERQAKELRSKEENDMEAAMRDQARGSREGPPAKKLGLREAGTNRHHNYANGLGRNRGDQAARPAPAGRERGRGD